jgi:hypothetical protein
MAYYRLSILTFITIISLHSLAIAEPIISTCAIDVYFSPNGGATETIYKEINSSKQV